MKDTVSYIELKFEKEKIYKPIKNGKYTLQQENEETINFIKKILKSEKYKIDFNNMKKGTIIYSLSNFCIDVENVFIFDGKETKEGIINEFKEINKSTIKSREKYKKEMEEYVLRNFRGEVIYLKPMKLTKEGFNIDKNFNKPRGNFSAVIGNYFVEQNNIKDFYKEINKFLGK